MYVTDSNTIIYYFKGNTKVAHRLLSVPPRDFAIPAIVLYELEVGTLNATTRREALNALVRASKVLPFDENAARHAALIRNALSSTGNLIGPLDILIAATAIANGATLVTHNTDDFKRIPGLQIEDWW